MANRPRLRPALLALVVAAACSRATQRPVPTPDARTPAPAESPRSYTEADVRFMRDMIHHHAQAILISEWAPTHGASAEIQRLAERIINAQKDEIASMQKWLRDRGHDAPEGKPMPMGGQMAHHAHGPLMAGMLSDEQLRELDAARGKEFDRLFLSNMIHHHQGAVTMVNELFGSQGAAQDESVFKLAADISADQSSEVARMQRMLAEIAIGIEIR
jgi:uncharacterized protein (DUF305 family)